MSAPAYDRIGLDYGQVRRSDPRIGGAIWAALGGAGTVLNVGAGAGSYEPTDREVIAVEPSAVMIAQRPSGAPVAIQAVAECAAARGQERRRNDGRLHAAALARPRPRP